MMTHEQKTRLGIFLAIATVIFLAVLGFFLVPKLREGGDVYYINFRNTSVYGLSVDSVVTYQGMNIGKVLRMELNPKSRDSVLVFIKIQKGFPIKTDTTAVLMFAGITGLKFIDLRGGSPDAAQLPPGGEIQTGRGLEEIAGNVVTNLGTAVNRINSLLSDQNRDQISRFLENIDKSSKVMASLLENKRASLENTLDNVERASAEFMAATENLRKISANIDAMSKKLDTSTVAAVDNITKRFSDEEMGRVIKDLDAFINTASETLTRIEGILDADQKEISRALAGLNKAMDNLSSFAREISEDPTSLIRTRKEKKK